VNNPRQACFTGSEGMGRIREVTNMFSCSRRWNGVGKQVPSVSRFKRGRGMGWLKKKPPLRLAFRAREGGKWGG
jgi:hypothetical protein